MGVEPPVVDVEMAGELAEREVSGSSSETEDEEDLEDAAIQTNIIEDIDVEISNGTEAMHIHESLQTQSMTAMALDGATDTDARPRDEAMLFVIDTVGEDSMMRKPKGKGKAPLRAASPSPSDSSGEEIVFRGRGQPTVLDDPIFVASKSQGRTSRRPRSTVPIQAKEDAHVTDGLLEALGVSTAPQPIEYASRAGWAKVPGLAAQWADPSESFTPVENGRCGNNFKPSAAVHVQQDQNEQPNSAGVGAEETIAELQAQWKEAKRSKKSTQKLSAEILERENSSRRGKRGRRKSNKLLRELNSDDSDENMAACKDYLENLRAQGEDVDIAQGVLSAAGGPSLVVDGKVIEEGDVLDASTRNIDYSQVRSLGISSADSDDEIIGEDLSEIEDDRVNASDYDSSDLENALEYDEQEQWEDEEDLRQRRRERMTDEQVARLLQKQEDMGIEGDDIVIDDGDFVDMDTDDEELGGFGDINEARARLESISFGQSTTHRPRRGGKKNGFSFPDASALADAIEQYGDNGFDIMDLDRPSLRPTKKGRKGKLPAELEALSDDDLRETLYGAWQTDRAKKSQKKREREEQRMRGLLGSAADNPSKADLSQKYTQGMTLIQVHEELRLFLLDDSQTARKFPPMATEDRAALHAIASRLNLTSKSQGQGKTRFPMLYKTTRTLAYNEAHFSRLLAASSRGFLKNSTHKGKANKFSSSARGGRGGFSSGRGGKAGGVGGHGLRDGEVVGANAEAISADNFGHRLMEKMGWTKGTALGKDGSGLLVPVSQVMKAGKAGLG